MPGIRHHRGWDIAEREATPECAYLNRRRFLMASAATGAGLLLGCTGGRSRADQKAEEAAIRIPEAPEGIYPAERNPAYTVDRPLTEEGVAATYNNFYEFSAVKDQVWRLVDRFRTRPWTVEVTGLVEKPGVFDVDDLVRRMPLEERLYRFRCVEAWAMTVPWTGFPLNALVKAVRPTSEARYVRMVTFLRPEEAVGQKRQQWYPWPYFEGLHMREAMNDLTLLVTGIYGHALPKQHGAPIRLIVPWKYGYKSIKSIVAIQFTRERPPTFWNRVAPDEYDFWSNVNPNVPHPRWSQRSERLIGTGERVPTQIYNGYGEYVAHLYG